MCGGAWRSWATWSKAGRRPGPCTPCVRVSPKRASRRLASQRRAWRGLASSRPGPRTHLTPPDDGAECAGVTLALPREVLSGGVSYGDAPRRIVPDPAHAMCGCHTQCAAMLRGVRLGVAGYGHVAFLVVCPEPLPPSSGRVLFCSIHTKTRGAHIKPLDGSRALWSGGESCKQSRLPDMYLFNHKGEAHNEARDA